MLTLPFSRRVQTVDSLEDALLDQRRQTMTVKICARTERERAGQEWERAEQATARAEKAHNNEAWWWVVYYQVRAVHDALARRTYTSYNRFRRTTSSMQKWQI